MRKNIKIKNILLIAGSILFITIISLFTYVQYKVLTAPTYIGKWSGKLGNIDISIELTKDQKYIQYFSIIQNDKKIDVEIIADYEEISRQNNNCEIVIKNPSIEIRSTLNENELNDINIESIKKAVIDDMNRNPTQKFEISHNELILKDNKGTVLIFQRE